MVHAEWTVADAKARLSELIERAGKAPQTITRRGKPAVVVVSVEEWGRRSERQGSLSDFFGASPLRHSGLEPARRKADSPPLDL